ncbi:MAG TPA: DUF1415 family protein [Kofleriaceae bacterium]|nr:DUF1415 family protein [Kofleriaceae bacterium]
MDAALEREARRLLRRYQVEVVERFGLCPWAEPARTRGEVRVDIVDEADAGAALDAFLGDASMTIGLVVMPRFTGDARALRRVRDELLTSARARVLALADFHPEAARDDATAERLVPWLRRSPDAMLQAVRHETLASLRRATTTLDPASQLAVLAGRVLTPRTDPAAVVAAMNHAVVRSQGDLVATALDAIARDRAETYAELDQLALERAESYAELDVRTRR